MSHHLVYNKNAPYHLYKKSGHLVRTPITITLQPDQMAVYQVAGSYRAEGSVWWADAGFIAQGTVANTRQMGYDCLQALLNHNDWRQNWQYITTSHKPEFVWYQGGYATSAANRTASLQSCEAYCQLAGYHFTVPSGLRTLDVTGGKIKFINGGAIECYQSAANQSTNNRLWQNAQGVPAGNRFWYGIFGVMNSLGDIQHIRNAPAEQFDLATTTGTPRGARDLWARTGLNTDGGIPTLVTPTQCQVALGASTQGAMNNNKTSGFWVVAHFVPTCSSINDYSPYYINTNNGYWGCASLWDITLEVELD